MIGIPIFFFVVLLIFFICGIILIVTTIVGYVAYCKAQDKKTRKAIEEKYGTRYEK